LRRGLRSVAALLALIGLGALALSRTELGAAHIQDLSNRMAPWSILISTLTVMAAYVFIGLRWRALMPPGARVPAGGLSAIILAGLLLNYALPGPAGELGAAWFAHRRYRVPLADALASGLTARLLGLATAALMAAGVWLATDIPTDPSAARAVAIGTAALGLGGLALAALAVRPGLWQAAARAALGPLVGRGGRTGRFGARAISAVDQLATAIAGVVSRGVGPIAHASLWSCMAHLSVTVGIAVAIWGMDGHFNAAGLAFTYVATTAGAVVLFALPGSQLGWDAMFMTLLVVTASVAQADAIAVAVLVRLQQLGFMVLGAGVVAWLIRPGGLDPEPAAGPAEPATFTPPP
jgi:hypothetical protein